MILPQTQNLRSPICANGLKSQTLSFSRTLTDRRIYGCEMPSRRGARPLSRARPQDQAFDNPGHREQWCHFSDQRGVRLFQCPRFPWAIAGPKLWRTVPADSQRTPQYCVPQNVHRCGVSPTYLAGAGIIPNTKPKAALTPPTSGDGRQPFSRHVCRKRIRSCMYAVSIVNGFISTRYLAETGSGERWPWRSLHVEGRPMSD
jgi:hypothetical protein